MDSEKVKEIKEKLEKEYFKLDKEYSDHLAYGGKADKREEEIYFLRDVIECINELEKKNAKLLDSVETVQNNRCVYKCELAKKQLKQFAERLKKRTILYSGINVKYEAITADIIDELLKEYEKWMNN